MTAEQIEKKKSVLAYKTLFFSKGEMKGYE